MFCRESSCISAPLAVVQRDLLTYLYWDLCADLVQQKNSISAKHLPDFTSVLKHHQLSLDFCMNVLTELVLLRLLSQRVNT